MSDDLQDVLDQTAVPIEDVSKTFDRTTPIKAIDDLIVRMAIENVTESQADDILNDVSVRTGRNKGPMDKQLKKARKEAKRAVAKKKSEFVDPRIQKYVDSHAKITLGGVPMIVDTREPREPNSLSTIPGFMGIHNKHWDDIFIDGADKPTTVYWAKEFAKKPPRATRNYTGGFTFDPREDAAQRCERESKLNLYTGMAISPAPGDWSLFRRLITEIWCDGDEELVEYVIEWLMHMVVRPGERVDTALAIRSSFGTGKTLVPKLMRDILGDMFLIVEKTDQVLGAFNGSVKGKILIALDEAAFGGDASQFDRLKHSITSDTIHINEKNKPAFDIDNYARIIIITNHDKMIHTQAGDRRYTALTANEEVAAEWKAKKLYEAMVEQWKNGGAAAFLHDAQNHVFRTIEGSKRLVIQNNIVTEGLAEQISMSRRGLEKVWAKLLLTGSLKYRDESGEVQPVQWGDGDYQCDWEVSSNDLLEAMVRSLPHGEAKHDFTLAQMWAALKRFGVVYEDDEIRRGGKVVRKLPSREWALSQAKAKGAITQVEYEEAIPETRSGVVRNVPTPEPRVVH